MLSDAIKAIQDEARAYERLTKLTRFAIALSQRNQKWALVSIDADACAAEMRGPNGDTMTLRISPYQEIAVYRNNERVAVVEVKLEGLTLSYDESVLNTILP